MPSKNQSDQHLRNIRLVLTIGGLSLALLHVCVPGLKIDHITLVLLAVAILPWLAPLIKSLELTGVGKVELRELQSAAFRAENAGLLAADSPSVGRNFSFESVAEQDPNLALAGLRIEIEKRLVTMAEALGLDNSRSKSVGQLLRVLTDHDVLTQEQRGVLTDMVQTLNAAVHGAKVDRRTADWAIDVGPRLLASLDEKGRELVSR